MLSPAEKQRRKELREKDKAELLATLTEGTILYSSWGYEQTNVEFFKVLAKKNTTVTLQEVRKTHLESTSHCSSRVTVGDGVVGEPFKKIVRSGSISLGRGYRYLRVWDGKPLHCSWGY